MSPSPLSRPFACSFLLKNCRAVKSTAVESRIYVYSSLPFLCSRQSLEFRIFRKLVPNKFDAGSSIAAHSYVGCDNLWRVLRFYERDDGDMVRVGGKSIAISVGCELGMRKLVYLSYFIPLMCYVCLCVCRENSIAVFGLSYTRLNFRCIIFGEMLLVI